MLPRCFRGFIAEPNQTEPYPTEPHLTKPNRTVKSRPCRTLLNPTVPNRELLATPRITVPCRDNTTSTYELLNVTTYVIHLKKILQLPACQQPCNNTTDDHRSTSHRCILQEGHPNILFLIPHHIRQPRCISPKH